jgi:hypothetical protein
MVGASLLDAGCRDQHRVVAQAKALGEIITRNR